MCRFKKQKKALTFYSQSLILPLQCLSFIILPYKTSALLTDFLFKDRQKLICAMERLENCDIDSLACYEVAVVKVVGEHSDDHNLQQV